MRGDEDFVPLADAESRQPVEAAAVGGTAPARQVHDLDVRVEARGGLDEAGGRASVQAEWIAYVEPERQPLLQRRRGACRALGLGLAGAELCGLPLQPAARFLRDLCEWLAEARGYPHGHAPLAARRLPPERGPALLRRQE